MFLKIWCIKDNYKSYYYNSIFVSIALILLELKVSIWIRRGKLLVHQRILTRWEVDKSTLIMPRGRGLKQLLLLLLLLLFAGLKLNVPIQVLFVSAIFLGLPYQLISWGLLGRDKHLADSQHSGQSHALSLQNLLHWPNVVFYDFSVLYLLSGPEVPQCVQDDVAVEDYWNVKWVIGQDNEVLIVLVCKAKQERGDHVPGPTHEENLCRVDYVQICIKECTVLVVLISLYQFVLNKVSETNIKAVAINVQTQSQESTEHTDCKKKHFILGVAGVSDLVRGKGNVAQQRQEHVGTEVPLHFDVHLLSQSHPLLRVGGYKYLVGLDHVNDD